MRDGLLRALCFHQAWGYPPTPAELVASWDRGLHGALSPSFFDAYQTLQALIAEGQIILFRGRVVFPGQEALIAEHEAREVFFPRKIRRAREVARWLVRLGGVRFVALCNTTALAHARDEGDLDLCVVTCSGSLWQTRGLAALPFKLLGMRPGASDDDRDSVCLSFLFDDSALDLTTLQITPDDPYFRHWFLSLLPLVDDGVGRELWDANASITSRHPLASAWLSHEEIVAHAPWMRIPWFSRFELLAHRTQARVLPAAVRKEANQSTNVVVNDHVLKLHVTDNRERYRKTYEEACRLYDVEP